MKTINIKDLEPGMFVVGVIKQAGHVRVKNQGWVRDENGIRNLIQSGVLEVEIDPDKTLHQNEEVDSVIEECAEPPQIDPWHKSVPVEAELGQAVKMYEQAKQLQEKAFTDIRDGRKIDVTEFKETASGFIDSVFRNQDALACIARIRDKDGYLLEHSLNVSILMSIFAKHLGFDRALIEELATGALLHDIGKIKIPDEILQKPEKLTENEFAIMREHAKYSHDIVKEAGLSSIASEIAGFHHERLNGTGYPFAKQGDELSQFVRMISIVDVYDALTAERVYKIGMTPIQAFKKLKAGCPDEFDEVLLNQFIHCIGMYPVGTLVKLKSHRVGIVAASNPDSPLQPVVKVFYNAKNMFHVEVRDIDLSDKRIDDELEAAVKPEEFGLDLIKFFRHSMLP
ncbi:HD-GYP domain-containing protein [Pseudoalteromonas sp. SMS1]|uniref:HD-GYP domain-containing protein n=1 Tax=Pseudoalteromonas sp. SMS1 TaxID=2908894 RepID=UPI001F45AD19|nr:HD-GYP domain-containing protein [Pseudoalteromonas sp. SMS1]MCF2856621.1 HD-GYP domain-containing protein [Pseudoalteromonas sp. SMS1]